MGLPKSVGYPLNEMKKAKSPREIFSIQAGPEVNFDWPSVIVHGLGIVVLSQGNLLCSMSNGFGLCGRNKNRACYLGIIPCLIPASFYSQSLVIMVILSDLKGCVFCHECAATNPLYFPCVSFLITDSPVIAVAGTSFIESFSESCTKGRIGLGPNVFAILFNVILGSHSRIGAIVTNLLLERSVDGIIKHPAADISIGISCHE